MESLFEKKKWLAIYINSTSGTVQRLFFPMDGFDHNSLQLQYKLLFKHFYDNIDPQEYKVTIKIGKIMTRSEI